MCTRATRRVVFLILSFTIAAGCHDEHEVVTNPGERLESGVAVASMPAIDQEDVQALFPGERSFVELAAVDPAFAGFHVDDGRLVVNVADPSRHAEVRSMVSARLADARRRPAPTQIETRQAMFSFLELANWRNLAHQEIMGLPDVVSLDLDERRNRVAIGLDTGSGEETVRRTLEALGVPPEAIVFDQDHRDVTSASLFQHQTPLPGGYRISVEDNSGAIGACSAGITARKYPSGTSVLITASHCTRSVFAPDAADTRAFNTSLTDTTHFLGNEETDPPFSLCGSFPARPCRPSDAALFTIPHDSAHFGFIARTTFSGSGSSTGSTIIDSSDPRFSIVGSSWYPASGDTVHKVGQEGGWTLGTIDDTCEEKEVNHQGTIIIVTCAYSADYRSDPGDSGAPVFARLGGDSVLIEGINYGSDGSYGNGAGNGRFSAFSAVDDDLGIMLFFEEDLDVSIPGPWEVPPDVECTFFASAWGGKPPYSYQWSGVLSGTGISVEGSLSSSGYLTVTVTDADSNQTADSKWIDVDEAYEECEY